MGLHVTVEKRLEHYGLDISLECGQDELLAVVGPSGAGKTTLLRLIAGLERPERGEIRFQDDLWASVDKGVFVEPKDRGLAFVFQNSLLLPHLSLAGNVAFAARDKGCVVPLLERFSIGHLAKAKPSSVSGGERQRAAFCQALAREPKLLLLDEPFSALDGNTRETLRRELKRIKEERGIPVVHVTHDLAEAEYLADRILAVDQGHVSDSWLEERRLLERQRGRAAKVRIAA